MTQQEQIRHLLGKGDSGNTEQSLAHRHLANPTGQAPSQAAEYAGWWPSGPVLGG